MNHSQSFAALEYPSQIIAIHPASLDGIDPTHEDDHHHIWLSDSLPNKSSDAPDGKLVVVMHVESRVAFEILLRSDASQEDIIDAVGRLRHAIHQSMYKGKARSSGACQNRGKICV